MELNESKITIKGVVLSIMIIAILFTIVRALNPVNSDLLLDDVYLTVLFSLFVAALVISLFLRRVQADVDMDDELIPLEYNSSIHSWHRSR
ncbi:MAG: hypothetical protein JW779_13110 [Candidatus Thorarchaeota archaeon]|nr:hypothetical protein [Candidatus Thorarchaeota archaeon]